MKLIFLDDERYPEDVTWVSYPEISKTIIVRTFEEFKAVVNSLSTLQDTVLSFDHDLQDFNGTEEYTGMTCVKYLVGLIMDNKHLNVSDLNYVIHSQNPVGALNMSSYFESYKRMVEN